MKDPLITQERLKKAKEDYEGRRCLVTNRNHKFRGLTGTITRIELMKFFNKLRVIVDMDNQQDAFFQIDDIEVFRKSEVEK